MRSVLRAALTRYLPIPAVALTSLVLGAPADLPDYSRPGAYPLAPAALGLPVGPGALAQSHPGLYADYEGEMFGEGAYYLVGPQQPQASRPVPDLALKPALCPELRLVALVHTGEVGADAFHVAQRLGATLTAVPIVFRELPKPPRGVRCTAVTMERLSAALAGKVDVILVNKLLAALPVEAQRQILQKVEAGAGLLMVGPFNGLQGPLLDRLPVTNPAQPYDDVLHDYRQVQPAEWLAQGVAFELWPGFDTAGLEKWVDYDPRHNNLIAFEPKPEARVAATLEGKPFVILGQIGQGRVALMGYAGNRWDGSYLPLAGDASNDLRLYHRAREYQEQMYSLLARALVFAAAGEPPVQVRWPVPGPVPVRPGQPVSLTVANRGQAAAKVRLRAVLRDGPTWGELCRDTQAVDVPAAGEATVGVRLPVLPAVEGASGRADPLLEVLVTDQGERPLDWGTVLTAVEGPTPPQVQLAADVVYPREELKAEVETAGPCTWRVADTWGRVLAAGRSDGGRFPIVLTPDFQSGLLALTVDSLDSGGRLAGRTIRSVCTPPVNRARDYYNLLWPRYGNPWDVREFNGPVLRRQGGIAAMLSGGYFTRPGSGETILRAGLHWAITNAGPRFPFSELPDWPAVAERNLAQAQRCYTGAIGRYGPLTVHLQDERHSPQLAPDLKLHAQVLERFRAWLGEQHGKDVSRLNREWLTEYKDFAEATPTLDPKAILACPGSYARWLDFVRFVDEQVGMAYDLKLVKLLEQETRGHVSVGFEGIFALYEGHLNPYSALNVPLFFDSGATMNNMAYGIGTPMWELCASLNPDADSATWLGYESERSVYRAEPWRGVLSGATFMGWFIDSLWFTAEGAVGERLEWIEQHTRPLRQGVGRLLIEGTREFDSVAILANMRSSQMAWLIGKQMDPAGDGRGSHWMLRPMGDSGTGFLNLCRDSGICPAYITEGQVLSGRLAPVKVLCLVFDSSVDERVAAAIREWVRAGGTLVADCAAGAANQHGRFLTPGLLDDVFGIRREGPLKLAAEAGDFTVGLMAPAEELVDAGCQKGNWYMVEYFEPNVTVDTAVAMGQYVFGQKPPMCFWNRFGQGRALYLGFLANRYRSSEADLTSLLPLFRSVLRRAGVAPRVQVSSGATGQLKGYTINHFSDGPQLYSAVMRRDPEAPTAIGLAFPQEGYAYEVMSNRYLGHGHEFRVDLASGEPVKAGMPTVGGATLATSQDPISGMGLFALLPGQVKGVSLEAERGVRGKPLVLRAEVVVAAGRAGKHVLHLDVRDPDGNPAEPYCGNVVTRDGVWQGTIPLALNDAKGTWTLTAREAISGLVGRARVTVK